MLAIMSRPRIVFARAFVLISAATVFVSCQAPHAHDGDRATDSAAAPALQNMDGFIGTWVNTDAFGQPTEEVVSDFRYTAGGSAISETMFPGADHEMITMYFASTDALYLTHYCGLGNHPNLVASMDAETGDLMFDCVGTGANFGACPDTDHMHSVRYHMEGDSLTASWKTMASGELTEPMVFSLKRK